MKISGFSFARNAQKLYYPVAESIKSILPICDEFIIAIGKGDEDDRTREEVEEIGDKRVKIIDTEWTDREKLKGAIHAQQTDIALQACTGDWCFYVQADEVVHERDLPTIKNRCEQLLDDTRVEGLLFNYKHFWGDYRHYHINHAWYPREIRIVRNGIGVRSYQTAQSFRIADRKLQVARVNADIFHYGFVRPPRLMSAKQKEFGTTHRGRQWAKENYANGVIPFDYGSLEHLAVYDDPPPTVMKEWIKRFDWAEQLQYSGPKRIIHKHDRFKYRLLTWIEQHLLGGELLFGFKNYKQILK